ncbi:MAG: hypothetical protein ABEI76_05710 [Halobacteriales archaeon]
MRTLPNADDGIGVNIRWSSADEQKLLTADEFAADQWIREQATLYPNGTIRANVTNEANGNTGAKVYSATAYDYSKLQLNDHGGNPGAEWDYVGLRYHISPEPSVQVGSEETQSSGQNSTDVSRFDTNGDGAISIMEMHNAINAYGEDSQIGDEPVTYGNVLSVIRAFQRASVDGSPVSDAEVTIDTDAGSTTVQPGDQFTLSYTLSNQGTSDAEAAGLRVNTPAGITVDSFSQDTGSTVVDKATVFYTGGLATSENKQVTVTFSVASDANAQNGTIQLTANGGDDEETHDTSVTIQRDSSDGGGSDDGSEDGTSGPFSLQAADTSTKPNSTVTVEFNFTNTNGTSLSGPALKVTDYPSTWQIADHDDAGSTYSESSGVPTWLWLQVSDGDSKQPTMTFEVPNSTEPGEYSVTAEGQTADGTTQTVTATVTVTERQQTNEKTIGRAIAGQDGTISITEIQQAIRYWATGSEVPDTGGETIGITKIQQLIKTWASGESVGGQ